MDQAAIAGDGGVIPWLHTRGDRRPKEAPSKLVVEEGAFSQVFGSLPPAKRGARLCVSYGGTNGAETEFEKALRRYAEALSITTTCGFAVRQPSAMAAMSFPGLSEVIQQKRIISELQQEGHSTLGASTMLRLLEQELASSQMALETLRPDNSPSS